jgi:predicted HTH transcriptional regulator
MALNAKITNQNDNAFIDDITDLIFQAFSFKMLPMTYVFIITGSSIGIISGIFWIYFIKNKKQILFQNEILSTDIQSLINSGESSYVEFKSSIRYDIKKHQVNTLLEEVIGKVIVGFLNSKGGKLIVGVDDSGEILGIDMDYNTLKQKNKDGFEQKIYDIINHNIGSEYTQYCKVIFHEINGKEISAIQVSNSHNPAYLKKNGETIFYVRMGNSTRKLSVKETVDYINLKHKY